MMWQMEISSNFERYTGPASVIALPESKLSKIVFHVLSIELLGHATRRGSSQKKEA